LLTTSSVSVDFLIAAELAQYYFVTGIVDDFAADGSAVDLLLTVKSGACLQETYEVVKGADKIVASETTMVWGDASLDENDRCRQDITFSFKPQSCYADPFELDLRMTTRVNTTNFDIELNVDIECSSFLDSLPIKGSLTFHETQDLLIAGTAQSTFHVGDEVFALLKTSTIVPLTNIDITQVDLHQVGHTGASSNVQLNPVVADVNDHFLYQDTYPAPTLGAETCMMYWDLESPDFTVSGSGHAVDVTVQFTVTYDQTWSSRRRELKFTISNVKEGMQFEGKEVRRTMQELPLADAEEYVATKDDKQEASFQLAGSDEAVGVSSVIEKTRDFGKFVVLGSTVAVSLAFYKYYQSRQEEKQALLDVYRVEEDVF